MVALLVPTMVWVRLRVPRAKKLIEFADTGFDWTTNLSAFPTKVLFLRGERNTVMTLEHQRRLAAHYPNAEIITIRGTRHPDKQQPVGSVFRIEDESAPFITVEGATQLRGLQFWYPKQTLSDPAKIGAWLFGIARHRCLDIEPQRRRKRGIDLPALAGTGIDQPLRP